MKEKLQNIYCLLIFMIISFGIGIFIVETTEAKSLLELYMEKGLPSKIDEETRCELKSLGENAKIEYEQCRQSYYLKKQTEFLQEQQVSQTTIEEKGQIIKELELNNQKLQELFKEQSQRIDSLTTSFKNAKLLNINLSLILAGSIVYLLLSFVRRKWKK
ncbi:hypothetical protein COS61_02050 [Candidatus Wolfebacteria bacterium CG03_land_8_20_14_0_80_40_12]|uniref:Uncharacterized protein n=1 Tax=Candidatus Wolfebacteria bacterium CG03_land_8_20_14_0_80_40_12 TaxID=1975069 RepID=A0A2M7B5B1_9BACT|nr:MAG: hypothetical protein COS61_02050 [Candidatus Wolfebacteria bacterium CG03_land_8_20_14_0_80_40_12]